MNYLQTAAQLDQLIDRIMAPRVDQRRRGARLVPAHGQLTRRDRIQLARAERRRAAAALADPASWLFAE